MTAQVRQMAKEITDSTAYVTNFIQLSSEKMRSNDALLDKALAGDVVAFAQAILNLKQVHEQMQILFNTVIDIEVNAGVGGIG